MRRIEFAVVTGALLVSACASDPDTNTGGAGTGGQTQGSGGTSAGGTASGGRAVTGGSGSGGVTPASGGSAKGGATNGGATSGGATSGGTAQAGGASGATSGGVSGAPSSGGSGGSIAQAGNAGAAGQAACAKAIFCEDFEKYAPGSAPSGVFKSQLSSGAISIDEAEHVSGKRSVKFTTFAKDGSKTAFLRLEGNPVFPVVGNAYYGRMMFLLQAAPTTAVHWTFIQSGGTISGQTYHALYRYGGQHPVQQSGMFAGNQLMANYETPDSYSGNGPKSDCWHHADQTVVPVGKWSCVEWSFDGPKNQMQLWLDGAKLDDLTVNGVGQGCVGQPATFPWTAPTFEHLDIGWESFQTDTERALYVDDLVLSKDPIGCP